MVHREDEQLIAAVCTKDQNAFEELVRRHEGVLRAHVTRIMGNQVSSEDVVQEVFLRVWTRAEQYSNRGSVRSWLFTIASNLAKNHLRSTDRRRETALDTTQQVAWGVDGPTDDPGEAAWMSSFVTHSPEAAVELLEKENVLAELVSRLPNGKREVVQLMLEHELAPKEVAEVLGVPPGTVRSRLHHARRILAPLLTNDIDAVEV